MSVVHNERVAFSAGRHARSRTLLKRLMIVCGTTGRPTDTGFELLGVPRASAQRQMLVDCLECGQDHEWRIEDTFLE
jgi:hypothetical protein